MPENFDKTKIIEIMREVKIISRSGLIIRESPNTISKSLGVIPYDKKVTAYYILDNWYFITYDDLEGWIDSKHTEIVSSQDYKPSSIMPVDVIIDGEDPEDTRTEKEKLYEEYTNAFESNNFSAVTNVLAKNMNGIFGMPYQFMNTVDRKINGTVFGRKYMERIVTKMPLLLISPGKVEFMPDSSKKEAAGVVMTLAGKKAGNNDNDLESILNNSGRYYSFAFNYTDYYKFVNAMCRSCSAFLGIDDVKITIGEYSAKLGRFDWSKSIGNDFGSYLSAKESIGFYVDSVNAVTDSFSNTTTESQIASKINSFSDIGKEIAFLLGTQAGKKIEFLDENEINNTLNSINEVADKYLNGNQLFKDLGSNFATIAAGGKILFPEIWDDSSFTRSFDISIKLRTPDCDPLSWYLNICVPMCFLIGLVAPKQQLQMGYNSPFLVRAFYKGLFNVDMGIVTDLSFSKGKEGAWTLDGLPTEVDVSMTIKDLYQAVLTITSGDQSKWFMNNTTLMDYMANMCGININKPDILRTFQIYTMLKTNKLVDMPNTLFSKLSQESTNLLMKAYQNIGNFFF